MTCWELNECLDLWSRGTAARDSILFWPTAAYTVLKAKGVYACILAEHICFPWPVIFHYHRQFIDGMKPPNSEHSSFYLRML